MTHAELSELPPVLRDFITYTQVIKGKSQNTAEEYFLDLRTFFRFLKLSRGMIDPSTEFEKIPIMDIDLEFIKTITLSDAVEFLSYCKTDRQNNASTRARKTSSLRSFFKYLTNKTGQLAVNPVEELDTPKLKKALPKYLTLEESLELLRAIDGEYKERDYCIITLFLNCGLRLSELCGLNLSDIRSDSTLRVTGKGNKERVVYLNNACLDALNHYLRVRPVDGVKDKNALFLSRLKKRISNKTVQHIVYENLEKSGLGDRGLSVHKLRHTAATLMYQYGEVDIRVLQDLLGHANLGTTEIYTHLSSQQLQKAATSSPLSNVKRKKEKEDTKT